MDKLKRSSIGEGCAVYFRRNGGMLIGLFLLCIVISIRSPLFLTQRNIMNVLRQISANMFLASSMTLVLIIGGIDLSVGSALALIGVISGFLLAAGVPAPLVVLCCLALGAVIGVINGVIIVNTTLPPFIVTFSMMSILRGIAYVSTGGTPMRIENRNFINVGTGYLGPVPLPVVYMGVIVAGLFLLMNKTSAGRHIYAIGGNDRAALYSGIPVKRIRFSVYVFSGVMAAVSGITLAARSYSGSPIFGTGAEMDAIAACVLGGISMLGGNGYIGGTLIGALIIGILNNGLNLMGIDSFWQTILRGVVILIAVYVDYIKNQKKFVLKK
ncbi:MAG: ribose ABC transporter permease [Treponema sp.]|nr:ribose ABC transporter permease [Treponema sp.]